MQLTFCIYGMDCAEEVSLLRSELSRLSEIKTMQFDLVRARLAVEVDADESFVASVIGAVERAGLRAELWNEAQSKSEAVSARAIRLTTTVGSGALIAVGLVLHAAVAGWNDALGLRGGYPIPVFVRVFYLAGLASGVWFVVPRAFLALRRLRPDMNLLMTVAIVGAVGLSEYLEAATVSFLFSVSLTLEAWSVARARRAVVSLMSLAPPKACVLDSDGREELKEVDALPIGTRLIVRPGEKFPLDGRIVRGETTVNQAPITGEATPVEKGVDAEVYAGTINEDGAVEIVTTKEASDTTLARIVRLVSEAQSRRSPSEQWVERFARIYTPAVMALALVVMSVLPLVLGGGFSPWFYEALVLLVIACPCALVISTPVSIVAALTSAARHGVLIKGGLYVEIPARLRAVAFDKTGTLTLGRPTVRRVVPFSGRSERDVLDLVVAVEKRSEHPLARAIVQYGVEQGVRAEPAECFRALKGRGATANVGGRSVWAGSPRLAKERGFPLDANLLGGTTGSIVVVGDDKGALGMVVVGDEVRPEAPQVVRDLRAAGVDRIVMLTGDSYASAQSVAKELGIDEIQAELLPENKVSVVESLVTQLRAVAMVGDGVNDAPAMARASLGIAMGAIGSDAAIETADVALMSDDLSRVPWLIGHSRATLRVIRQNIIASLAVKAAFVLLTLTGHATLWAAIAADMGVSLLVVLNALRLLKPPGRWGLA